MKRLLIISGLCLLTFTSCQTVRTVYDESGNEVKEREGGERSLEDYMSETFDRDVTRKKNDEGVPESSSTKVSRYQSALDNARRDSTTFSTGSYNGLRSYGGTGRYAEANRTFDRGEAFSGTHENTEYRTDLRPAFMSDTRGVFSRDDAYGVSSASRASADGRANAAYSTSNTYSTSRSNISRNTTSGYYESRLNNFPRPRIINRDEYYRRTIEETRTMLGRDNAPSAE